MTRTDIPFLTPRDVARILVAHPRRWLIPVLVFGILAAAYAVVRKDTWQASLALLIRQEAAGVQERFDPFTDAENLKSTQETVLELARSKSVLQAALEEVGPARVGWFASEFPTDAHVESLRDGLDMSPPNGAEFGMTEVFYLKVKNADRDRALALVTAVCNQLEERFKGLRQDQALSKIDEMDRSVAVAEEELARATHELASLEGEVGADLAELRMLNASASAQSDVRQKLVQMENEIRGFEVERRRNEQLLEVLRQAAKDPVKFLASPNSLLAAHPSLRRLKDGLVDAQISTARMQGTMSDEHPQVLASKVSVEKIRMNLRNELQSAIAAIQIELEMTTDRVDALRARLDLDTARLQRLASLRADYGNLLAKAANRTELLETARRNLADAQADLAAARGVSLISRIDLPDAGTHPVGPGGKMIVLAGMLAGLLTGLAIVYLTVEPFPAPGKRIDFAEALGATQASVPARTDPLPTPAPAMSPAMTPATAHQEPWPAPAQDAWRPEHAAPAAAAVTPETPSPSYEIPTEIAPPLPPIVIEIPSIGLTLRGALTRLNELNGGNGPTTPR